MKTTEMNIIAQNQNAEKEAAAKAAKEAEIKAIIDGVQKCDILVMLAEVYEGKINAITDSNDNIIGVNRPHEITGLKCAKRINGVLVVGNDEKELEQDKINYRKFEKQYHEIEGGVQKAFEACLLLAKAELHPDKAAYIKNTYYFILASQKKVIDEKGHTIIDLNSEEYEGASDALMIRLLDSELRAQVK